jgi:hypothetical protein
MDLHRRVINVRSAMPRCRALVVQTGRSPLNLKAFLQLNTLNDSLCNIQPNSGVPRLLSRGPWRVGLYLRWGPGAKLLIRGSEERSSLKLADLSLFNKKSVHKTSAEVIKFDAIYDCRTVCSATNCTKNYKVN